MEFDKDVEEWKKIGTMQDSRVKHAVSVIRMGDFSAWCD